jgi:hypothetical protein
MTERADPSGSPLLRDFRFPLAQPRNPWRRAARTLAGYALCALQSELASALDRGEGPEVLTRRHHMMLAALMHRARWRGDLERFIHQQQQRFWGTGAIADFHDVQHDYFERNFLGANRVTLDVLEAELARGGFDTLCEIGCGNGRVVEYLSGHLTSLRRFVGIDLSAERIRRNAAQYPHGRVDWVAGDAKRWIAENGRPGWVFLSHNGVLEYFLREDLVSLFGDIAARRRPAIASVSEPIAVDYDLARETASRPYGDEHSFSHNYVHLLEKAGFCILHQSEFRDGSHRLLRIVAKAA